MVRTMTLGLTKMYKITWSRLPPTMIGCTIDRGHDFPEHIQSALDAFGPMWHYRDDSSRVTARSRNTYRGDERMYD